MALEMQDEAALKLLIADGRRVQEENVRKKKLDMEEKEHNNELDAD